MRGVVELSLFYDPIPPWRGEGKAEQRAGHAGLALE